jgi:hypothetical protein
MSDHIAHDLRHKACALALPAFPLVLLAGSLVSPTDSSGNAEQLRVAAVHGGRWQGAALLELLAAALLPFAVAAVVGVVRGRGARLANVGGVLGVLGTLGMASIAFRHLYIYGLAGSAQAPALRALDRMDNHTGAIALPLMFAAPIALLLLAAAATRAQLVSRWVVVAAFAFFVSDMLPIPAGEVIQGLIGIITFGTIARQIMRIDQDTLPATLPRLEPATAS